MSKKLRRIIEKNKLYLTLWAVALTVVVSVNSLSKTAKRFVGVTVSKGFKINLKYPSTIKTLRVLEGELVKEGELLAILDRPELTQQIKTIQFQLEGLKLKSRQNEQLNQKLQSVTFKDVDSLTGLDIEIKSLEQELASLKKQQELLYIFSPAAGFVGDLNFKKGEAVSPYTPIMTIYNEKPTLVQAYIQENIGSILSEGVQVKITSSISGESVTGKVFSVGSRIVPFDERFLKDPGTKVWGREVSIMLPESNKFLLGEKVAVRYKPSQDFDFFNTAIASKGKTDNLIYQRVKAPVQLFEENIELSGIVYHPGIGRFLVISDDNKKNQPFLYELKASSMRLIERKKVKGLKKVDDMEALAIDSRNNIIVVTSHSQNKKGEIPKARGKIHQVAHEGDKAQLLASLDIIDVLKLFIEKSDDLTIKQLVDKEGALKIDFEAATVSGGSLYLGVRRPQLASKELIILKIADIQSAFEKREVALEHLSLWRKILNPVSSDVDLSEGISGMHMHGEDLYFTTANNNKKGVGRLMLLKKGQRKPVELYRFNRYRPEGVTVRNDEAVVIFDKNDGKPPYIFAKIKI